MSLLIPLMQLKFLKDNFFPLIKNVPYSEIHRKTFIQRKSFLLFHLNPAPPPLKIGMKMGCVKYGKNHGQVKILTHFIAHVSLKSSNCAFKQGLTGFIYAYLKYLLRFKIAFTQCNLLSISNFQIKTLSSQLCFRDWENNCC